MEDTRAASQAAGLDETGTRSRWGATAGFAACAAGVAVAALGQGLTSRDLDSRLGLLHRPARYLNDIYPAHQPSIVFAAVLLVAGAAVFVWALRGTAPEQEIVPRDAPATRIVVGRASLRLLILGIAPWMYLIWRLWRDEYRAALPVIFALAIGCVWLALALASRGEQAPSRHRLSLRPWEILLVLAALGFFLAVNVRDVNSWRYAAIGDEYPFFDYARGMASGALKANVFSQLGVWQQRPVGTSAVQAVSMWIFGEDSYGWRIATPLVLAAAIPAVYILARELFSRTVAVFATLVFTTSHYLMSYSHTGYDNVFAITPFVWCVALAVVGLRRSSATWMYLAGVVGGLGFYTFPTARMAPVVVLLALVAFGPRAWRPRVWLPLGVGLLIAGLPLFATDGWNAIAVSSDRTVFGFTSSSTEGVRIRLVENVPRTLLSFNVNPDPVHFASGSLLDPVAAVLLVLGVGYGISRVGQPAYRLLAIWLAVALLFSGIFSPYDRTASDRLHLALPVISIYAGVALAAIVSAAEGALPAGRIPSGYLAVIVFVVLAPVLAYVNLQRFLVESPRVTPTTEERIVMGGLENSACRGDGPALLIIRMPDTLLKRALAAHGYSRDVSTRAVPDAVAAQDYDQYACVVITRLKHPAPGEVSGARPLTCYQSCWREADAAVNHVEDDFGFHQAASVWTPTAHFEAIVLTR